MTRLSICAVTVLLIGVGTAQAAVIDFDDLTTRDNFFDLGITSTYQGFDWGYSNTPGIPSTTVIPTTASTGWASATTTSPSVAPAPTPVSGKSYAWNWNGPQGLWIDFGAPTDVTGAYFATLSSNYHLNASSITMYGYDATDTLVATSSTLALTHSFQYLAAGFTGISKLEMRANANAQWFSIDNLDVGPGKAVPLPAPGLLALGGLGLLGIAARIRRRRQS
jgi:hypothetical protein